MTHKSASIFQLKQQVESSHEVLELIGVYSDRVHKHPPKECLLCKDDEFSELELVGIDDKPLFWECEECGSLYCRQTREFIEALIDIKTANTWSVDSDWIKPDRAKFN